MIRLGPLSRAVMQPEDVVSGDLHDEGYPPSESLGSVSRSRTQTESVGQQQPYSFRPNAYYKNFNTHRQSNKAEFKNFDLDEHGGTLDYDARR